MDNLLNVAIEEAEEFLAEAEWLFKGGFYRGLINRCYYSYYWLIKGVLSTIDVETKSHKGIQMMFAQHFIKTEAIPLKFNNYLSQLSEERGVADYDLDDEFSKEDAIEALEMVKEFLNYITKDFNT